MPVVTHFTFWKITFQRNCWTNKKEKSRCVSCVCVCLVCMCMSLCILCMCSVLHMLLNLFTLLVKNPPVSCWQTQKVSSVWPRASCNNNPFKDGLFQTSTILFIRGSRYNNPCNVTWNEGWQCIIVNRPQPALHLPACLLRANVFNLPQEPAADYF